MTDVSLKGRYALIRSDGSQELETKVESDITSPSYTFDSGDLNNTVKLTENSASAITMTIPPSLGQVGDSITVIKQGTGAITWAGDVGVTLNSSGGSFDVGDQWAVTTAIQIATDSWILTGERA